MSETRAAIGVDIGGTKVKGGIVSSKGALLCRVEHDTDVHAGTKSILGTVHELLERSGELGVNIECIGVGAAGFIDSRSGTVVFAANLVYDDPK
ncbi:MAG: ROK family protein, partial [Actinobacteria bacterium]|nr:ROK family protein [Actinomycetota bacterium]